MKHILILTTIIALLLTLTACKKPALEQKPLTPVTVTLDWTPNTNHTGLYVALEQGLYKAQGLDVKIVQPGESVTDQLVAAGKSQFGISYQENVTRAQSEGIPLVSIAAVIQHNTSGFASLRSANIHTPKDFEGKRYGSWDSPSEMAVLAAVMQKSNADVRKVKVVSGVMSFFDTIGKTADFEWIYAGWDGVEAKLRKMDINYIPLRELDPVLDYYTPVIITNESMRYDHQDICTAFMKATSAGYAFSFANPDSAAKILLKHAPELKPELVMESQRYLSKQYQADSPKWGLQKEIVWQQFAGWMYKQGLIKKPANTNALFTNAFLPK